MKKTSLQVSVFPSKIVPEFLYLGSYDNASSVPMHRSVSPNNQIASNDV
ncbi:unnamed protein product [Camellia sinensis]